MTEIVEKNVSSKRTSPEQTKINTLKAKQRYNEFLKTVRQNRHLTPQQMVDQGLITAHEATLQGADVSKLVKYHKEYFVNNRDHILDTRLRGFKTCDLCGVHFNCMPTLKNHRNGERCIQTQNKIKRMEELTESDLEVKPEKLWYECDLCGVKLGSRHGVNRHKLSRRCIRMQHINELIKEKINSEEEKSESDLIVHFD